ncbi:MAG: transcriptional regulator [Thermodesulfobacteriota bacterium]
MGMEQTVRQCLITLLLEEGPLTAKELSGLAGIPEKEVRLHLPHIRKSLAVSGQRLEMEASVCLVCGFAFSKRERLTKPSHCPRCRQTHIEDPRFRVVGP